MRKYTAVPHPFIIEPPLERQRTYKPGDRISFGLTLIGRACDYLPYFIYAFSELGGIGLGRGKGRFELEKVKANNRIIYNSKEKILKQFKTGNFSIKHLLPDSGNSRISSLNLDFLTPTRIIYNKHLTFDLEFHILIRNLLRRLSLLYYFHADGDSSEWDFKGVIRKAEGIKVSKKNLKWYEWEKYSARQNTKMKMGGFVGSITFEGNIKPFLPLIKAGEVLHVGKGTGFGLGKYEIEN